jgi:FMN phosphatase YigB (HAD superfamily)
MKNINFNNSDIKVVWFDLDHTLYPASEEINKVIQDYICERIAEKKWWTFEIARQEWDRVYSEVWSWWKTLKQLWVKTDNDIVQEALENADFAKYLHPDLTIIDMLVKIRARFIVDLITGSSYDFTIKKLKHLKISTRLFSNILDWSFSKSDGTAYKEWLNKYEILWFSPKNFVYIWDRYEIDIIEPKKFGINWILVKDDEKDYDCIKVKNLIDIEKLLL